MHAVIHLDERDFVLLARLVRPQGRHGEVLADILTDFPDKFAERRRVWLLAGDARTPLRELTVEDHWLHKGRIVLKFAGIDSISDAGALKESYVAIPREARAPIPGDEVYIADLIGCRIVEQAAGDATIGVVTDVERGLNGAPDMLVVKTDGEELLIPFVKAYLVEMNLDARLLRMRLPAGLTAINSPLTDEERAAQKQRED